jgi:glutamate-1-semialdehyde 2,1-aminomutase
MAEEICKPGAVDGAGAPGVVGHRRHHERAAAARGATGRDKIVKFEGCYHGHADSLLKAGSGLLTFGNPTSAGVPETSSSTRWCSTITTCSRSKAFASYGDEIACVIVEPVAGNMNLIKATEIPAHAARAVHAARRAADLRRGDVRLPRGAGRRAAAVRHQAGPDRAGQGDRRRHAGGGVRRQRALLMGKMAPLGAVYQAGTLSGNPVAVAAGMTTLQADPGSGLLRQAGRAAARLAAGLTAAAKTQHRACADSVGGMFGLLRRRRAEQLRRDDGRRPRALQRVLPRHAR